MPSSATITAFYSFSANTKARANQVNNNFSAYRGHIIAIDPNTATAATTETYDLGSTEYRWRTGYFREVDFKSNTSTGNTVVIKGSDGAFEIFIAGSTIGSFDTNGLVVSGRHIVQPTYSSDLGSKNINTNTMSAISGSTVTFSSIGKPIRIGLVPTSTFDLTGGAAFIEVVSGTTTINAIARIALCKNTTTSVVSTFSFRPTFGITTGGNLYVGSVIDSIDFGVTSGTTNNYFLMAVTVSLTNGSAVINGRLRAFST